MADSTAPQSADANICTCMPVLELLLKAHQGTETQNHPVALSKVPGWLILLSHVA